MTYIHKNLADGQWHRMSFFDQMANIGSEIGRTISWREKNIEYSQRAFERALELLDLTIGDERNISRLKELCRLREILVDHFAFDNTYHSTDDLWQKYFYAFNFAARAKY